MFPKPLRLLLSLQSLLAIALPFGIVALFGFFWFLPQIRTDSEMRHLQLARAIGMQVESHMRTGAALIRAAAAINRSNTQAGSGEQHLDALLESTDAINTLYVISSDGTVTDVVLKREEKTHHDDLIGLNLSGNPLFRELSRDGKPHWSKTFLSVINGGLVVAYGLRDGSTTVIGEVELSLLTKFLQHVSPEKDTLILIVDHIGQVVADSNGRYTAQQLNISNIPFVRAGIDSDAQTTGRFDFAGDSMTGSIIQIPGVDWHVMVAKTNTSLYRTSRNTVLIVLAGILVALLCGVLTSLYLARKLALRFNGLTAHARDIAKGNISDKWPTSTIAEFNQLSDSLHSMSTTLQQREIILRESEERYRALVDNIPLGISLTDTDHRIIMINTTLADMFGQPAEWFKNRFCYEVFEKRPEVCSHCSDTVCMTTGLLAHAYTTGIRDDGSRFDAHIRSVPLMGANKEPYGFIEVVEDITERTRAEEERLKLEHQILHAQKLESLGILAGGIAHDFNNILTAIIGNADLALMRLSPESPAVGNLHSIEQAAARAADLARQMLAYSGKGKFVVENLDLNVLLEEMLHMLEVSISKKAVLRLNLHQQLPPVEADATQMRQIIMNLVINASEAIGDTSGVIAITSGRMECDRSYLKDVWLDENLTDGLYVYLEIADSGCGMDRETMAKLFDPFFTTKFTGRGLGMAAVLGIVRGHKGAIKVYSEPGKGTTFKILLPASDRPAELFNHNNHTDDWKGSGTVLLVDDEETIRGIGTEMLKELGFTTITANDGREAIEIFKSTPDIAFVILDLTMPHMDGEECFRELRKLNPDVKVIMSSGYNEQEVTQKFVGKGLAGFIQKPYKLSVLKETIKKLNSTR